MPLQALKHFSHHFWTVDCIKSLQPSFVSRDEKPERKELGEPETLELRLLPLGCKAGMHISPQSRSIWMCSMNKVAWELQNKLEDLATYGPKRILQSWIMRWTQFTTLHYASWWKVTARLKNIQFLTLTKSCCLVKFCVSCQAVSTPSKGGGDILRHGPVWTATTERSTHVVLIGMCFQSCRSQHDQHVRFPRCRSSTTQDPAAWRISRLRSQGAYKHVQPPAKKSRILHHVLGDEIQTNGDDHTNLSTIHGYSWHIYPETDWTFC